MVEEQSVTVLKNATPDTSFLVRPDSSFENTEEFQLPSVPETKEPKICGRCCEEVADLFDSEICNHETCVACRFKYDVQCTFCTTNEPEETDSTIKKDVSLLNTFVKKKVIKKDHIVDVQQEDDTSVPKQMCTVCQRVFLKTNSRYHYACASGERPLQCIECGQRFVKKSHLESHMNSHFGIKPFKCNVPKCKASFSQKDKLVRHMKTHCSEKHKCDKCNQVYTSLPILRFHMKKVHSTSKLFKCDICPRTYKYQRTLTVHRLKHQGLKDHLCEICGKKYAVSAQLKQHKRSHIPISKRPYKCQRLCKKRFMTLHDKDRHELIHDHTSSTDFECSLCNTTFGRKDNLERHMKNFHQEPSNLEKSVKLTPALPRCNLKKSNFENNLSKIKNNKKPNNITDTCSKVINVEKVCKIRIKARKKKNINCPVKVNETIKTLGTANFKENLNQPEINHTKTVIVRPSVIKKVQNLKLFTVIPEDENYQNIDSNENLSLANTSFTVTS